MPRPLFSVVSIILTSLLLSVIILSCLSCSDASVNNEEAPLVENSAGLWLTSDSKAVEEASDKKLKYLFSDAWEREKRIAMSSSSTASSDALLVSKREKSRKSRHHKEANMDDDRVVDNDQHHQGVSSKWEGQDNYLVNDQKIPSEENEQVSRVECPKSTFL